MYVGAGVYSFIINIMGMASGVLFAVVIVRDRKFLSNKLPKKYFTWMAVGAVIFSLSFFLDLLNTFIPKEIWMTDSIHHFMLIVSAMIFIFTSLNLLQDVKGESPE
jgi:drug/metabolite transporter (DMT)-like permease